MTEEEPQSIADLQIQTTCQLLIAAVAVGGALYWLQSVMIPFVLATFLALGLAPIADFQMRRLRVPKTLAVFATLILAAGLCTIGFAIVSSAVTQLAAGASEYQKGLTQLLNWAAEALPLERLGITEEEVRAPLSRIPIATVSGMLLGTTTAILDLLSQAMLVSVFAIFLLIAFTGREPSHGLWGQAQRQVKSFLVAKVTVSAVTGVLVGVTLKLLGVELALAFGLFAFLLNFIPTIGSVVSTFLPLPILLLNPEIGLGVGAAAILIPGSIHFGIGNVVEPLVMGDSLELHPVAILVALMIWGVLWGVVGMLLATPITSVMRILFARMPQTRPIANLLAGRLDQAPG
ncbi:MAG: AI-2E family transporter [Deltaproteobacteria bacterium]